MFDAVCVAIRDALGFEKVARLPRRGGGELVAAAGVGWHGRARRELPARDRSGVARCSTPPSSARAASCSSATRP